MAVHAAADVAVTVWWGRLEACPSGEARGGFFGPHGPMAGWKPAPLLKAGWKPAPLLKAGLPACPTDTSPGIRKNRGAPIDNAASGSKDAP
jgi:hypothetical protein